MFAEELLLGVISLGNKVANVIHEWAAAAYFALLIEMAYHGIALFSLGVATYKRAEVTLLGHQLFCCDGAGGKQRLLKFREVNQAMQHPVGEAVAAVIFPEFVGQAIIKPIQVNGVVFACIEDADSFEIVDVWSECIAQDEICMLFFLERNVNDWKNACARNS